MHLRSIATWDRRSGLKLWDPKCVIGKRLFKYSGQICIYTAHAQKLPFRAVNQNSDITNRCSECNFLKRISYNLGIRQCFRAFLHCKCGKSALFLFAIHLTSRLQNLCLSSAVAARLISLGAAFRDTLTVVVPEKWLCHSGHVNRFCYLLTYLLTWPNDVEHVSGVLAAREICQLFYCWYYVFSCCEFDLWPFDLELL